MPNESTKMDKIRYIVFIAIVLTLLPFSNASAGIFDWLNDYDKTEESTENIPFDTIFNSLKNKKETTESEVSIENNSVLTMVSHLTPKAKVAKKNNPTYTVTATAYSSTPDQTDDSPFITASGTYVRDGIVATNFLPFGTVIKIPNLYGDKLFVVEDRMNRRYTDRVDIWFPNRSSAIQFGKRNIVIEVVSFPEA